MMTSYILPVSIKTRFVHILISKSSLILTHIPNGILFNSLPVATSAFCVNKQIMDALPGCGNKTMPSQAFRPYKPLIS